MVSIQTRASRFAGTFFGEGAKTLNERERLISAALQCRARRYYFHDFTRGIQFTGARVSGVIRRAQPA